MAKNPSPCHGEDEDYIDMELTSSPNLFRLPERASPQSRDFEFQMSSIVSNGRNSTTSPADELFYKGKLLPLYLPPRLEMVQTLLRSSLNPVSELSKQAPEDDEEGEEVGKCGIPFISISTAPSTNINTPLDSCNISPSESCRVSCELNPADYFFEWSTELSSFINTIPKKSWSKKLKMIRHLSLSQKLKASRAYLKSLFSKSACSDESAGSKEAARNLDAEKELKSKDFSSKYVKVVGKKSNPFGHGSRGPYPTIANLIKRIDKEGMEETMDKHRRSFSGAIKRHSPSKCLSSSSSTSSSSSGASSSSSSFSIKSNALYESNPYKRSSSDTSDIEISIQSAIAHCKNSHLGTNPRNSLSEEAGECSLSSSLNLAEALIVGPMLDELLKFVLGNIGNFVLSLSFFPGIYIVQLDAIILGNTSGPQGPDPRGH